MASINTIICNVKKLLAHYKQIESLTNYVSTTLQKVCACTAVSIIQIFLVTVAVTL